jgi:sugar phosphate isomerase/epimerase
MSVKLGVISQNLMQFKFEEGLRHARDLGFQAVEVGACGLWGRNFCDVEKLLADKGEIDRWLEAFARHDLEISALGGHGAPLLPDKTVAEEYSREFRQTCKLMELAGIKRLTLLAGLPEGAEGDTAPNWVTFAEWPFLRDTLKWQWEKRLIPYWREHGKIAHDHGVTLCFEMHGGDLIHNPVALKRLHEELGPVVGCNFDISHMWYQGIDPIEALRYLGPLVQHVHAKDVLIHQHNVRLRGMMATIPNEQLTERPWTYTLSGWGHDEVAWREFVTTLHLLGYDHVLSVEMESEYFDVEEGLAKSVAFLKPLVLEKPPGPKWWEIAGMGRAGGLTQDRGEKG